MSKSNTSSSSSNISSSSSFDTTTEGSPSSRSPTWPPGVTPPAAGLGLLSTNPSGAPHLVVTVARQHHPQGIQIKLSLLLSHLAREGNHGHNLGHHQLLLQGHHEEKPRLSTHQCLSHKYLSQRHQSGQHHPQGIHIRRIVTQAIQVEIQFSVSPHPDKYSPGLVPT